MPNRPPPLPPGQQHRGGVAFGLNLANNTGELLAKKAIRRTVGSQATPEGTIAWELILPAPPRGKGGKQGSMGRWKTLSGGCRADERTDVRCGFLHTVRCMESFVHQRWFEPPNPPPHSVRVPESTPTLPTFPNHPHPLTPPQSEGGSPDHPSPLRHPTFPSNPGGQVVDLSSGEVWQCRPGHAAEWDAFTACDRANRSYAIHPNSYQGESSRP